MIARRWTAGAPLRAIAASSIRHRTGQVVALAITLALSATIIAACVTLIQTGTSSVVSTGELSTPPMVLAPSQDVSGDGESFALPTRPTVDPDAVSAVRALRPEAAVADRRVPATATAGDKSRALVVHPTAAMRITGSSVDDGTTPNGSADVVLDSRTAAALGATVGSTVRIGWGGKPIELVVSGTYRTPDSALAESSAYVPDARFEALFPNVSPVVIAVWPGDVDTDMVAEVADGYGIRVWDPADRGRIEVISQGSAKQTMVTIGGAFAGTATVVALFVITTVVSLQVRERSREISLMRMVGATPAQATGVLLSEIRMTSLAAGIVGAVLGPFLGTALVALMRLSGLAPEGLGAVTGTFPSLVAIVLALLVSEIAARIAVRGVTQGSPVTVLTMLGAARRTVSPVRGVLGVLILAGGIAMSTAPAFVTGEAAVALPAVSALVILIGIAALGPLVIRVALALSRIVGFRGISGRRSANRFLAYSSIRSRLPTTASAAVPVILGVAIACTQLFIGASTSKVADAEIADGRRGDLSVVNTTSGVDPTVLQAIADTPGVRDVQPVVNTQVVARCECADPSTQAISAYGVEIGTPVRFADLGPRDGSTEVSVGAEDVAIGRNTSGTLTAPVGSTLRITLPGGRVVSRKVVSEYTRDTGFAGLVLPMSDMSTVHPTGFPTAAVIFTDPGGSTTEVKRSVERAIDGLPGVSLSDSTTDPGIGSPANESVLQITLLLMLFGYIAIAAVNSLVIATLGRSAEVSTMNLVGATPGQMRAMITAEAIFIAGTGVVVGTAVAAPGLIGNIYALSDGQTFVPGFSPMAYTVIVVLSFGVVVTALRTSLRMALPRAVRH